MEFKLDQDRFFRKLTLQAAGCLEIEKAVQRCLDLFSAVMPVDYMAFHQYSHHSGILRTPAMATSRGVRKMDHEMNIPVPVREEIIRRWATRVWVIDRFDKDAITSEAALSLGLTDTSAMLMDLTLGGRYTGIVSVANGQDYHYTGMDADLLTASNEPLALAFINGMRFRELAVSRDHLESDNHILWNELSRATTKPVIGAKQGLKETMDQAGRVAPTKSPVLLSGETGTGKEVIARAIHEASPRRRQPFISVNCGALPHNLADSELFGHEKGAFTGALKQHKGYFERAHGGTLFLDEIGELTPDVQVRLLRVLQENEIDRVGSGRTIDIDTRIIAATNRNLEALVSRGEFRQDLYFRIRVFPIHIPPLRERICDIASLIRYFVEIKAIEMNKFPIPDIPDASLEKLRRYDWPGNVRELENMVERALILHRDGPLFIVPIDSLNPVDPRPQDPDAVQHHREKGGVPTLDRVIISHIRQVLDMTDGRVEGRGGAAELLDVNPSTLRVRMKKYGIPYGRNYKAIVGPYAGSGKIPC